MTATRWNVPKVAAIGAAVGVVYIAAQAVVSQAGAPLETHIGSMAGAAIGGAILFGVIALIRNAATRAQ